MRTTVLLSLLLAIGTTEVVADVATLKDRQETLNAALKKVQPALVSVQDGFGAGSGVVVSGDGIVLTASHVVDTRRRQRPRLKVVFPDGSEYRAELLGMNKSVDAAMLKISERYRKGKSFPFVEMGDSNEVERGEWCFALGHPGGFRKDRPAPVRLGRVLSTGYRTVVSDCAIVLGDSGGPLFDISGRLIGIHSMITEVIVENRHVAIDCFRRDGDRMEDGDTWGQLRSHDNDIIESGFVGAALRWRSFTPEVSRIKRDSPASKAGLRTGDIVLKIANQTFADPLGLSNLLSEVAENQKVEVVVDRHGKDVTLTMTTGRRPRGGSSDGRQVGTIRVEDEEHETELRNQLTSLRTVGPYEKRSVEELDRFEPVVEDAKDCVAEIRKYGQTVSLGTVMTSDGYILTKASEVNNVPRCMCVLSDGRNLRPREIAVDYAYDLMLIKVEANGLQPAPWATADSPAGSIVITTDSRGTPLLPGVVSVATRKLPTATKGFLGVGLKRFIGEDGNPGVLIDRVFRGGAALRAGIKEGDRVLNVDGQRILSVDRMMRLIRSFPPNKKIEVQVRRGQSTKNISVVLTPRFIEDQGDVMLPRYFDPEKLGKFASAHNSGFPQALQHDTDLFPNQCGGPLFDINGKAVGLNIARAARITSYAIPAAAVKKVFAELKAKDAGKTLKQAS